MQVYSLEDVRKVDFRETVTSFSFAADGHTVLVAGDLSQKKGVKLWNIDNGEETRTFEIPGLFVVCAPGRQLAAVAGIGTSVQLLDLQDGKVLREFSHGALLLALAFSPNGNRLATAGIDKVVCVWDVATAQELARLKGHEGAVFDVAFAGDGQRIVTASEDKTARVWDANSGEMQRVIPHASRVWRAVVSPDGRQILTGTGGPLVGLPARMDVVTIKDNAVRLWDLESGKLLHEMDGHSDAVRSLAFHPRLPVAASGGLDKRIMLWDLNTGKMLCRVNCESWIASAAFSPDGEYLLTGGGAYKKELHWIKVPNERLHQFRLIHLSADATGGRSAP